VIDITYTLSEADFSEAQKLWCGTELKKLPGRKLIFGLALVFGGLLGWDIGSMPTWLKASMAIVILAIVFTTQWRQKAVRRYQYELKAKDFDHIQTRIDGGGYWCGKEGLSNGWIAWAAFTGWRETPRIIVLGMGLSFITIPKSALSPEQQTELRTLLQTNIRPAA
jgi:hypothetical protein